MTGRTLLGVLILLSTTSWLKGQSRPATRTRAFDNVIALAKASAQEPSPVRLDLDVQVLVWAPTALVPVPFLRLTHTPGNDLQANVLVWWLQSSAVGPGLPLDRRCGAPGQDTPVCVAQIEVAGSVDWGEVLANIFASRACSLWFSGPLSVTADAGDLVVRVYEPGTDRYEEYMCNAPHGASGAGARHAAQVMDVLQKAATAARRQ
jgi:hypothetical protein